MSESQLGGVADDSPKAGAGRIREPTLHNLKELQKTSPNLLGNIAGGFTVFLMVTDVNPLVRKIFCAPKEAYDPQANKDFKYGRPLPPLNDLVQSSTVIALKLPVATEEKLAQIMGTLLKQDW